MKNSEIPRCYSPVITASYRSKSMKGEMEDDIRHEIGRLAALDHEALKMEYLSRFGGTAETDSSASPRMTAANSSNCSRGSPARTDAQTHAPRARRTPPCAASPTPGCTRDASSP